MRNTTATCIHCLLDLVEQKFEPVTLQAFRRLTLDGASGAEVAQELGLSVAAVYVAKSRVLRASARRQKGSSIEPSCKVFWPFCDSLLGSCIVGDCPTNPRLQRR